MSQVSNDIQQPIANPCGKFISQIGMEGNDNPIVLQDIITETGIQIVTENNQNLIIE